MTLTLNGKTQLASAWAKEVGIPIATIVSRKGRGWSDDKTLTEPLFSNDTKITKNDAELELNDKSFDDVNDIETLHALCPRNIKKPGQYIRRFYPLKFSEWFNEEYKPRKQNELRMQKHVNLS